MYLLPVPQICSTNSHKFILKYDTVIQLDSRLGLQELYYATILQGQIEESLGFTLPVTKSFYQESNAVVLTVSGELRTQEYHIHIQMDQVVLTGGSSSSLLYAVQTLRQIIIQQGAILEGLEIIDYPEIQNRGFYYDVTRGRIPTLKTMKELADRMSFYKLNQLQLYMEHSFLLKGFSEVWRDDTPLTPEEILMLDEYCQRLHIELVPSIASFGHLHKILSTKTYSGLCELEGSEQEQFSYVNRMLHHTVDVSNEESFEMIKNMLTQFLPLFSSERINICADETFDLGKGRSKSLSDRIGKEQMYTGFLKQLCDFVKMHGKQPMFWGDILINAPEAFKSLPEDAVCLNWDYSPQPKEDNIKKLSDLGVRQYVCPGVHGWKRLINSLSISYDNILAMSRYAHKYKAEGVLNTDWGDYGHINHPEFSTAGMIYGAAFSWNAEVIGFDEINRGISALEYLDPSRGFVAAVDRIAKADHLLWEHLVQYKEACENRIELGEDAEYFSRVDTKQLEETGTDLEEAVEAMYRIIGRMDSARRERVKAYLMAAEGIRLFLALITKTVQYGYQKASFQSKDAFTLAEKIEYWFREYKEIWRKQYKESELSRLGEVIFWYTDMLRTMKNEALKLKITGKKEK